MGRYQILSSAPAGAGDVQSSHPEYPRVHESCESKEEASCFAKVLKTYYSAWHMAVRVVVFDVTTGTIVEP